MASLVVFRRVQGLTVMTGPWADGHREDGGSYDDRKGGSGENEGKKREDEESEYEESEYDWDEAQNLAKEKGFQLKAEYSWYLFRYREMLWEQKDDRWCSRWRWTRWERTEVWAKRVEDLRECAIRAWDAADVPQETLLRVVECLVGSYLSTTLEIEEVVRADQCIPRVEGVGNLALVCRAWYTIIAPALYSKLEVRDKVLGPPLRESLARHASQIQVRSNRPFISSAMVAQSAPRPSPGVSLRWTGPDRNEASTSVDAPYHPTHAAIYVQLHRSYSNVISLSLWKCAFLSSPDLLRLLAAFSALQRVYLKTVSVTHVSGSVVRRARPFATPIRYIYADEDCTPPDLPFATHCWTWSYRPPNHHVPSFHGLHPAEQQLVARASGLAKQLERAAYYTLDATDKDGGTCK